MAALSMSFSLIQHTVPDHLRGRVVSIYMVAFRGGMPLGSLATGFASSFLSVPIVLAINGGLVSLAGLYFLLQNRQVREL